MRLSLDVVHASSLTSIRMKRNFVLEQHTFAKLLDMLHLCRNIDQTVLTSDAILVVQPLLADVIPNPVLGYLTFELKFRDETMNPNWQMLGIRMLTSNWILDRLAARSLAAPHASMFSEQYLRSETPSSQLNFISVIFGIGAINFIDANDAIVNNRKHKNIVL